MGVKFKPKVVLVVALIFASVFIASVITTGVISLKSSLNTGNVIHGANGLPRLKDGIDNPGPPHPRGLV